MTGGLQDGAGTVVAVLAATTAVVLAAGIGVGLVAPGQAFGDRDAARGGESAHVKPDANGGPADPDVVERQLSDRLASGLRIDPGSLDPGTVNRTREFLAGTRYESLLSSYANATAETGRNNRTVALSRAREDQVAFVSAVEDYWSTHERYRQVRQRVDGGTAPSAIRVGPENRTVENPERYLAHLLDRHWSRVTRTHADLVASYRRAATVTEGEFAASVRSANRSHADVRTTHRTVRDAELVPTTLTVRAESADASFADPLELDGRLTTNDGTPVADVAVRIVLDNRTVRDRTDAGGNVSVTYRPTLRRAGASEIYVESVPGTDSPYARASERVPVSIRQVTPEIEVAAGPDSVGYAETLRVTGHVGDGRTGSAGIPYLVTVDGRYLARSATGVNGRIDAAVPLDGSVRPGERTVRVVTLIEGRAVAPSSGTAPVRVAETPTTVSVSTRGLDGRTLGVSGRLATTAGDGVDGQQVRLRVNGTAVGTTLTGPDGRYETTVVVPRTHADGGLLAGRGPIVVNASFDGRGTNLGPASGTVESTSPTVIGPTLLVGVSVVLVTVAGIGYWQLSRRRDGPTVTVDRPTEIDPGRGRRGGATNRREAAADPASLFTHARRRLAAGQPEVAVWAGYAATRRAVARRFDDAPSGTHWEFYRACREGDLDEATLESLRSVTELYERVAFSADGVSVATASDGLARMRLLAGEADGGGGGDGGASE